MRLNRRLLQLPLLASDLPNHSSNNGVQPQAGYIQGSSPFCGPFNEHVNASLKYYDVPGLAMALVDGSQTYSRGFGIAQFPDTPVTPQTLFFAGSTTKAFTAAAISLLIDDQTTYPDLSWTTPIHSLIPEDFMLTDDYSTLHVTLEDAATHRSGLPRHDLSIKGGNQTARDVVRSMRYLPLTKPLRTTFQYCNLMFTALGYVVEVLSGRWPGDFLADRIWTPLNMTSTYFSLADARKSGKPLAHGYVWVNGSQSFKKTAYEDLRAVEGAGAVISTVDDYANWVRMMIGRDAPLSKAGHAALVSPHIVIGDEDGIGPFMYGYGWEIVPYRGHKIILHNGAVAGFGAMVLYIPDRQWGSVMMANSGSRAQAVMEVLTWQLVDDLLEVPESERINRTAIWDEHMALERAIRNTTYVRDSLFPPDVTANISASLPLNQYAGIYTHPAYGDFNITFENGTLYNHMTRKFVLEWTASLEHVSGDTFFVVAHSADTPEDPLYTIAEFRVDVSGHVQKVGVLMEPEMLPHSIWFDKA